jgi:hypothetical protein
VGGPGSGPRGAQRSPDRLEEIIVPPSGDDPDVVHRASTVRGMPDLLALAGWHRVTAITGHHPARELDDEERAALLDDLVDRL